MATEIIKTTDLPLFTKGLAAALFQTCRSLSKDVKKLTQAGISLACKITELRPPAEWSIDGCLEVKMAERIGYDFRIFDVYGFMSGRKGDESQDCRLRRVEEVFWSEKIKSFKPFGGEIELEYLGLGIMEEEEVVIFERVKCIELEWEKIRRVKAILGAGLG